MGRLLLELAFRAEEGRIIVRRAETGWIVRYRYKERDRTFMGATLLIAMTRAVRGICQDEQVEESAPTGRKEGFDREETIKEAMVRAVPGVYTTHPEMYQRKPE